VSRIICATRAGEGSRAVQKAAIEQAKATGQHLLFLYIIDSEILEALDESMQPSVRVELYWLGKTLLRIAESRARTAGLSPELVIREGRVRDELRKLAENAETSRLLLGAPRRQSVNAFQEDEIESFAHSLEEETGVCVQIVRPAETASPVKPNAPSGSTSKL
jgi:hypothetical protein